MGSGRQMSSICIEKPVAGNSGEAMTTDCRTRGSQRKVIVVALLAVFLPFVVTQSYLYYMNPDAPAQAASFFRGKTMPSSSSSTQHDHEVPVYEDREISSLAKTINDTHLHSDDVQEQPEAMHADVTPNAKNFTSSLVSDDEIKGDSTPTLDKMDSETEKQRGSVEEGSKSEEKSDSSLIEENAKNESSASEDESPTKIRDISEESDEKANVTLKSEAQSEDGNTTGNLVANTTANLVANTTANLMANTTVNLVANTTKSERKEACDLLKGKWVPDSRLPVYTNSTCKFIQGHQNCIRNGRLDLSFLKWKWQPEKCDLPRIDARSFLNAMRNRAMAFAGDSIARNQFQSLLCQLSQVEVPENTFHAPDDRDNVHLFPTFNFTLAIYWSPYLVHVEDKMLTFTNNVTQAVAHIHIDRLDDAWVKRVRGVDILQISTGQWWFKRGLFLKGGQPIGGHICDGWPGCDKEIGFSDAYTTGFHTILKGSLSIPGFNGVTVLRSFSPDHFEGGQWDNGGHCNRTSPGGVEISWLTKSMYEIQREVLLNVTGELGPRQSRLKLLDITELAQLRADGHPNVYMNFQPFAKEYTKRVISDCLHWCLPGPIDVWNDILVESLHDTIYG